MAKFFNLVRVSTATVGTGPITLGSAVVNARTFAQGGALDGDTGVLYGIADAAGSEMGFGTYSTSGPTLTRDYVVASTNNNTPIVLSGNAQVYSTPLAESLGFSNPNILYNGAMEIDQANEGAAVTATGLYVVDGWLQDWLQGGSGPAVLSHARDTVVPAGFLNSLKVLVSGAAYVGATQAADYWILSQKIEGQELVDTGFGTANAQPLAVSFWLRTSISGTWGVCVRNTAGDRRYISTVATVANTWKYSTRLIPGDIGGTWATSGTGMGLQLLVVLAAGATYQGTAGSWVAAGITTSAQTQLWTSANATANLTGVKLEVGSVPTPFKRSPFSQEFARCQRYYEKSYNIGVAPGAVTYVGCDLLYSNTGGAGGARTGPYNTLKRATPTIIFYSPVTGASGKVRDDQNSADVNPVLQDAGMHGHGWFASASAGVLVNLTAQWTADARL